MFTRLLVTTLNPLVSPTAYACARVKEGERERERERKNNISKEDAEGLRNDVNDYGETDIYVHTYFTYTSIEVNIYTYTYITASRDELRRRAVWGTCPAKSRPK